MFGFISKKKLKKDMERAKKDTLTAFREMKATHPKSAQYWQGYEDGNANVINYVLHKYCK